MYMAERRQSRATKRETRAPVLLQVTLYSAAMLGLCAGRRRGVVLLGWGLRRASGFFESQIGEVQALVGGACLCFLVCLLLTVLGSPCPQPAVSRALTSVM